MKSTGWGLSLRAGAMAASFFAAVIAVPGHAQTAQQVDALVKAIADAGCVVTEANNEAILASAGVNEDLASEIVEALLNDGRAAVDESNLRLKTGGCS